LLENVYVAYRTSLSEGTEVFHSNVRERWMRGEPEVVEAMRTWAGYAERGREALLARDPATLHCLVNSNFDLRARLYRISAGNLEMVQAARKAGASSNFAGSGGAIVGLYPDAAAYERLVEEMRPLGIAVIKPKI
jgi:glucuronokinase